MCSYLKSEIAVNRSIIGSYAAWSNDKKVLQECSSGGVAFELGRYFLVQGYKICGVRFNADKNQAEHYIANSLEELVPSIGSKYIQSYTVDGFEQIDRKQKYLVVGTPCQIDSFRRYIQKFKCEDNFVLLDFFCHGVPSKLLWNKYVSAIKKKVGEITHVSWRNKFSGENESWLMAPGCEKRKMVNWHESYNLFIRGEQGYINSHYKQGNLFYMCFFGHLCLGEQCHKDCKYKYMASSADIRIGDCWGKTFSGNEEGVSVVLVFSGRGSDALNNSNVYLKELPIETVTEGQMKKNASKSPLRPLFMNILKRDRSSLLPLKIILNVHRGITLIYRLFQIPEKLGRRAFIN